MDRKQIEKGNHAVILIYDRRRRATIDNRAEDAFGHGSRSVESLVHPARSDQMVVHSLFDDATVLEYDNPIGSRDGR